MDKTRSLLPSHEKRCAKGQILNLLCLRMSSIHLFRALPLHRLSEGCFKSYKLQFVSSRENHLSCYVSDCSFHFGCFHVPKHSCRFFFLQDFLKCSMLCKIHFVFLCLSNLSINSSEMTRVHPLLHLLSPLFGKCMLKYKVLENSPL